MVATPVKTEKRLSLQVAEIAPDITAIRSLDWDRDRFDFELPHQMRRMLGMGKKTLVKLGL